MTVFHLKYRPQKLSDLDLPDVAETLKKIFSAKETPQSFLFTGPKGAGKTSAARIVARVVNCLNPDGIEPCGECENCKEILNGSSIDLVEIDAASNRGIEDIRSLKEKSYLSPSKLKKKVFIIDEVHMLTKEAFNALLKLIEEPPKHTIFILCTTDPQKIPETILSRLIKIDFRKGKKEELLGSLNKIIEGEKIKIDKESLDLIIKRSDGSFRNLSRTFNEIFLQFGKEIKKENVEDFLNNRSGGYLELEFEEDLVNGDAKIILEKMEKMAENGVNFADLREKFLLFFQKRLLSYYGINEDGEKPGEGLVLKDLTKLINLLIGASKQEKDVSIGQLPLELAVIEFLDNKKDGEIRTKKNEDEPKKEKEVSVEIEVEVEEEVTLERVGNLSIAEIENGWGNVLMGVKPYNHSVEAFLRATRPKTIKNGVLILEVFYPFHKDRLEEAKNKKIIEMVFKNVFKIDLGFECVLGKNKKEPLVIKNDTPVENISEQLAQEKKENDIYDVAKEIFG